MQKHLPRRPTAMTSFDLALVSCSDTLDSIAVVLSLGHPARSLQTIEHRPKLALSRGWWDNIELGARQVQTGEGFIQDRVRTVTNDFREICRQVRTAGTEMVDHVAQLFNQQHAT
jgi:hypothetical protein